jgi:hypothetical protein
MRMGTDASVVKISSGIDPLEYCHEQGWTDGLPVVPPTPDRVQAMLATGDRKPAEVLGVFPPPPVEILPALLRASYQL